jgi:hypothetical protein
MQEAKKGVIDGKTGSDQVLGEQALAMADTKLRLHNHNHVLLKSSEQVHFRLEAKHGRGGREKRETRRLVVRWHLRWQGTVGGTDST